MDENAFRIVIAVGVGLVAIALIAQAIAMSAIYRVSLAIHQRVEALLRQADPVLAKLEPVVEKSGPLIEKVIPMLEKAGGAFEKVGQAADGTSSVMASVKHVVDDNRPRIAEICGEAVTIAETSRQQVERLGNLIYEAGGIARSRLEQIDHAVETTVGQVEHAGDSIREAVLRPVREVNGLAAGISAAVSTLVKGPHRSSVEHATQDEEMFI
jgi:hypothetical protein